jgi:hypothetical protein
MLKKRGAIALLQPLENLANTLGCNGHLISPFLWFICYFRMTRRRAGSL